MPEMTHPVALVRKTNGPDMIGTSVTEFVGGAVKIPMPCLRRVLMASVQGAIEPAPPLRVIRPIGSPPRAEGDPEDRAVGEVDVPDS
jgi:hypothetical protein